jgi:hypothetical protein
MPSSQSPTALQLFRNGHDTRAIATVLNISEAEALHQVSSERSTLLGRPNPYPSYKVPWPSGRVSYAGRE